MKLTAKQQAALLTAAERKMIKETERIEKAIGVTWQPQEEALPATIAMLKKAA